VPLLVSWESAPGHPLQLTGPGPVTALAPGGRRLPTAAVPLTVRRVADVFAELARRHGLEDRDGASPGGLPEKYLYSSDMTYRYAFGRWWGAVHPETTDVWVLLNPATGTPNSGGDRPWSGASPAARRTAAAG
jgi:hypothetical protein